MEKFGLGDLSEEENSRWRQIDDEILDHELRELMSGEKQTRKVTGICYEYDRAKLEGCCRGIYNIGGGTDKGEISYKNCRNKEVLCI